MMSNSVCLFLTFSTVALLFCCRAEPEAGEKDQMDFEDAMDKRYMRFGRSHEIPAEARVDLGASNQLSSLSSSSSDNALPALAAEYLLQQPSGDWTIAKRYMRFGRRFDNIPLLPSNLVEKRYMRFGRSANNKRSP